MKPLLYLLSLTILVLSCEQDAGEGGLASISGKIYTQEINRYGEEVSVYPAADKNVFITYGDDNFYGDMVEANHDGYFEFEYLAAGDYTLWYYTDDTSGTSESGETINQITVSLDRKEKKELSNIAHIRLVDFDDGFATISGRVFIINYFNSTVPPYTEADIKDITPQQEADVYLIHESGITYSERERTNHDGRFEFKNLIKGNYRVYVYSEDIEGGRYNEDSPNVLTLPASDGTYDLVLYRDVTINETYQKVAVNDFYAEQE
jgi:hypothetical protein